MAASGEDRGVWPSLMAAAQAGDRAAYTRLLVEITPFLRALLGRRVRHADMLEDIVQDVLLTVHRVRHTYDPARPLPPWLASIAARRAIDAARRERWSRAAHDVRDRDVRDRDARDQAADASPGRAMEASLEAYQQAAMLHDAIVGLPRRQREALQLVKLDELSLAEGAARSGQSKGALKVNVHRAIRALRRRLREG